MPIYSALKTKIHATEALPGLFFWVQNLILPPREFHSFKTDWFLNLCL